MESDSADPELHVRQDEEYLFGLYEAKLIAEKLNMKVIQNRRMEEGMIMSKSKRKLLENFSNLSSKFAVIGRGN
ncbi:hypothetical protein QJS10_CPB17g01832 [Acorus calamus]|uniref:Uncharacterized protein n=1 Tax=Acorus calamus TaxID=4465 RepID=A0AAV9CVM3_ACOCL|nr:hypothetical protein QJS10_CPB17g01832 [Acorus calamus]